MSRINHATTLQRFREIPGVGPAVAADLWALGFREVKDLRDRNPGEMYEALCQLQGQRVDRCMLYVFRCAVYYASRKRHNPEKLKWWNWKDVPPASPSRKQS